MLPSLALVATAFFTKTMALQQSPPSLVSSRSSTSLASKGSRRLEWQIPPSTKQIHLVILVHGWLGSPAEMSSIQQALEARIEGNSSKEDANDEENENENGAALDPAADLATIPEGTHLIMHSAECNDGKTTDGVLPGGKRVADEINQIIRDLLVEDEDVSKADVSLSFIGNSLGGLYSRAAIADVNWDLPNGKKLYPSIFCTTCTPHLGKRGLTYLPIPRFAEQGIGYALQPTGQDLFGLNTVIEDLATQSKYLDPLKRFSKRIAYANAFGTGKLADATLIPTS